MAQLEHTLKVKTDTEEFVLHGRPCELSAFSFVPPSRHVPKELTYYNVDKQERYSYSTFDRQFLKDFGYNQKLHRDDREHYNARGLVLNQEEVSRVVPALSSSEYGKRAAYDIRACQNNRINIVETDFYRRNGTDPNTERDVKLLPR